MPTLRAKRRRNAVGWAKGGFARAHADIRESKTGLPARLAAARTTLFSDFQRPPLREAADRIIRLIEDLDGLRERAAVVQDEVSTRLAEQMNTAMYRLSIAATIFPPLPLFTGLPGINAGGIPETGWPRAVCAMLAVMTGVAIWLIGRLGRR